VRVIAHHGDLAFAQSIEQVRRAGTGRMLGLLGGGIIRRVHPRFTAEALGVGGFDAVFRPEVRFAPALGARVGVAWLPRRWRLATVQLSVTGVADVNGGADPFTLFTTVSTGFDVARR
jgi:hypothetical protein